MMLFRKITGSMISATLGISAAAIAQSDSAPSRQYSYEIQNAIVPAFSKYDLCLQNRDGIDAGRAVQQAQEAINRCKTTRSIAIEEAKVALASDPKWTDSNAIDIEVRKTFDQRDIALVGIAKAAEAHLKTIVEGDSFKGNRIIARGLPVIMEEQVAPASTLYASCLGSRTASHRVMEPRDMVRDAKNDIKRCAHERAEAIAQADQALAGANGWDNPEKRKSSINDTFNQMDASHIRHAEELQAFFDNRR